MPEVMPETGLLLQMLVFLMAIGAFSGVLAGMLGVGGGIVLVPGYFYMFSALGYDGPQLMQVCLATSLATIIVTSMRSLSGHHKKGAVEWPVIKSWAIGIGIGALVGVAVASNLRSETLQAIFGALGLVVGLWLAFGRADLRIAQEMPRGITRAILSPILGFLSVLMGIGGGSFGVPLMTLYNMPIHRAVATASGFGMMIAVPSVAGFLLLPVEDAPPFTLGAINGVALLITVLMTLVTTPWGVRIAHAMDPKPLKRVFAAFLIAVALNMLRKALGY